MTDQRIALKHQAFAKLAFEGAKVIIVFLTNASFNDQLYAAADRRATLSLLLRTKGGERFRRGVRIEKSRMKTDNRTHGRDRLTERDKNTERDRQTETKTETERDRERGTERQTEKDRQRRT